MSSDNIELKFHRLLEQYQDMLYWHIRRMVVSHEDAQDLTQETFILVYKNLAQLKNEKAEKAWLYRIATNCSLKFLQSKKIEGTSLDDETCGLVDKMYSSADVDLSDTMLLTLQEAILRLPDKQRTVFNLRYYDELTYEEMSQVLGTSESALKTNFHIAKQKVSKYMIDHLDKI